MELTIEASGRLVQHVRASGRRVHRLLSLVAAMACIAAGLALM